MKILHIHNHTRFGGGGDRVAADTVRGLRDAGHEVIEFVKDSRDLSGLGGKIRAFRSGLRSREAERELDALIEQERPDVAHFHELYPLISPTILPVLTQAGVPVLMSVHEYRLTCPIGTHLRKGQACTACMDRGSWQAARHNCRGSLPESIAYAARHHRAIKRRLHHQHVGAFLTASQHMRSWLIQAGYPEERVQTLPFPIDLNPAPEIDINQSPYALYVGRIVPEKGIETLLAAASLQGPSLHLRLVGPGGQGLSLPPNVKYLGELQGQALSNAYAGARFLVVPSEWDEPYGLVAGEAQLAGTPVIATRVGGLQELVEDGETGLLVPPADPQALGTAMQTLWQDPGRCEAMGRQGQALIRERCSLEAHVAGLIDLYPKLHAGPFPAPVVPRA